MSPPQQHFLSLSTKPARLTPEQAAWLLGFQLHDIPLLVATGLLKPLGAPPANGLKHFATVDLDNLRSDARWLARATDAIHRHWKRKNGQKTTNAGRCGAPDTVELGPTA